MSEKKHTLWPIGILFIIVLGIVLIVISIRISSRQSIDTDHTFNMKRLELNENINSIMQKQNIFESHYKVHISTVGDKTENAPIMKNPYYITPVPRDIPEGEGLFQAENNAITIYLEKRDNADFSEYENSIIFPYALEFARLDQGEKKVDTIYVPLYNDGNNIYTTHYFNLPKPGYYQVRLAIMVVQHFGKNVSEKDSAIVADSNKDNLGIPLSIKLALKRYYDLYRNSLVFYKVYFYHWIFNGTHNSNKHVGDDL